MSFNPTSGPSGTTVTYDWSFTNDADNNLEVSCTDGSSETLGGSPGSGSFTASSTITCTGTVENSAGQQDTCKAKFTQAGPGLSCVPASQTVNVSDTATLTASGGTDPYAWTTAGDCVPCSGGGPSFSPTYSSAGTKMVELRSGPDTTTCEVVVNPAGIPTCTIAGPPSATVGTPFNVTWSNSSDIGDTPEDIIESLGWPVTPSTSMSAPGAGAIPACPPNPAADCIWGGLTFTAAGTASVTIRVTNAGGTGTCGYLVSATSSCGDTICDASAGETPASCPPDCACTNPPWTGAWESGGAGMPVEAVHFSGNLKLRIDALRADAGLPSFAWGPPPAAGAPISQVHLNQLRDALEQVYFQCGEPTPSWAVPDPMQQNIPTQWSHIQELRDEAEHAP